MNRRQFLGASGAIVLAPTHLRSSPAEVAFKESEAKIDVLAGGQLITTFHFDSQWAKPFLHPLRTPSGVVVSRGFPLEKVDGESNDHPWHRGILYGHGDINGADFWRERSPETAGRLTPKTRPRTSRREGAGVLEVQLDMLTPGGTPLGTILQGCRFAHAAGHYLIDIRLAIAADRGVALKMGDTSDGGLGVRLADEFRQDRGATLRNAEGLTGTENIWGKRSPWVDYSSLVKGRKAGVCVFDHPANPRHPTYWHARGYGLFAANPFGERDYLRDKTKDGSMTIAANERAEFRYRVVIHDGDAADAEVEKLYGQYSSGV